MHTLTKLFVVLLVILSLVQSAGIVVFVSKTENFKTKADAAEARAKSAEADRDRKIADASAETTRANRAATLLQAALDANAKALGDLQQQLAAKDVLAAQLNAQIAAQQSAISKLGEGFKASEDAKSKLTESLASTRTEKDAFQKQTAELNATLTDMVNKLEVTERERRFLAEQVTEQKNQVTKLSSAVKDMGGDVRLVVASNNGVGTKAGAPKINGVIRAVKTIADKPYATISLGSVDSVIKGMEFKVIDSEKGEFLGLLVIDTVEPNEASGRLSGPRLDEIRPGVEARTQF